MMKTWMIAGALVAGVIGVQAQALAQQTKAPVYRYCLVESSGGFRGSGGGSTLCRFNTWAQCLASKTGISDYCIINPELTRVR
jgi:hypothetical protein